MFKKSIKYAGFLVFSLSFILSQLNAFTAFEAHVVNVMATIKNDLPLLTPPGGDYCIDDIILGSFDIPDIEGAYIWFTVGPGGVEPICDDTGYGDIYDNEEDTFGIGNNMNIVKARTCHGGKQSAVMTWIFNFSIENCGYICGNGIIETGEECDDGNNNNFDGCSSTCKTEQFYCNPNQELVINGGFEEPAVSASEKWDIFTSSEVLGWGVGWVSTEDPYNGWEQPAEANLELHRGVNNWIVFEGNQYVELDTDWNGHNNGNLNNEPASAKIYQDILTIPGFTYDIKFAFSARPNTNEYNNNLEFSWEGEVKDSISAAGGVNNYWQEYSYSFQANSDISRIQFSDKGTPDSFGTFLDAVSVKCVPPEQEPEPICGNGIVEIGEECDDGNTDDGDGCSCLCQIEEEEEELDTCMKINEVYYDPDDDHQGQPNEKKFEWIELYNACDYTVNIKNWYLEDNQGESEKEIINSNHEVGSGEFVVIAANAAVWNTYWTEIPNNAFKIALGGDEMFDGLDNDGDRVFLYDNNNNLIDTVSWGTDISAFNPSVTDVDEGHSIARKTKGVDTDVADDWEDLEGPNPGTNPHSNNSEEGILNEEDDEENNEE